MQIRLSAKVYMDGKEFEGELIFNTPYPSQEDTSVVVQWQALKDMPKASMGLSVKQWDLWQVLKSFKGAKKERIKWSNERRAY